LRTEPVSHSIDAGRSTLRAVVTGSSGFIGHHLAEALVRSGHAVLGLDIRSPEQPIDGVDHVHCDLLDRERLTRSLGDFAPDIVFHLAARTDLDEQRELGGYAANIEGVENLVEAVRNTPGVRRCICTSSQLVCRIGYVPAGPEDYAPNTLYGESKVRTERIWRRGDGGGAEWVIVRPTTVWGPGMNPHYLTFFRMVRDGRYFHVGGGHVLKSYGYVGNIVAQYLALMTAPVSQIHAQTLYLSDYTPVTIADWANAFQRALGAPPIRSLPLPVARVGALFGDSINALGVKRFPLNSFRLNNVLTPSAVDVTSTREVCGDSPFTMEQGVAATVRWLHDVWGAHGGANGAR
jgi:nucleoside-diphosphate-sugar epimerase